MRAILAHIQTHECSPIADADTFTDLPDDLMLIPEDQWEAEPEPGQLWQGNLPATFYAPVLPVPEEITMRQARLVLLGAGLLHVVDGALAGLPSPIKEAAQIEWEYSSTVKRSSPLIAQLGPALGLTQAQVDDLFRAGAAL